MRKTIKKLNLALPVLCLAMTLPVNQAKAAVVNPNTTPFQVNATVASACTIAATDLNFTPSYIGNLLDGQSAITVTCSNGTAYSLELDNGGAGGNNPNQRRMTFNNNNLTYNLYKDNARTQVWGTSNQDRMNGLTGSSAAQVYPVFGRIPAGQTVPAGNYTDTVQVTLVIAP